MVDFDEIARLAEMGEGRAPRNLKFAGVECTPEQIIDRQLDKVIFPPYVRPKYLGRKPTLTQAIETEICDAIAHGCPPRAAAQSVGISRACWDNWMCNYPEFVDAIRSAESMAEKVAAKTVARQDPKFWLSQSPATKQAWGKHDVLEQSTTESAPAGTVRLEAVLSVEQLQSLLTMRTQLDKANAQALLEAKPVDAEVIS